MQCIYPLFPLVFFVVLLASCHLRDYYALSPLGDDHYLRMVVETPAGDCTLYQYDIFDRKFIPRMPIAHGLPANWNLGFVPSGKPDAKVPRLSEVLLISPRKCQGTLIKVVPVALLYFTTDSSKALLVAIPADPSERYEATEEEELLSLKSPEIFSRVEEKIAQQIFQAPSGELSWTDQTGAWRYIIHRMNNL